jgi:hypothetical protein
VKKPETVPSAADVARLRRQASSFARYEDAYAIVRACAAHLKRLEKQGERALARATRGVGVIVLRRLESDMRRDGDGRAIFDEVSKAIGKLVPLFSKTLFTKAPRARAERPAIGRAVPRAKVDGGLTREALVALAKRVKSDEIETPEALRWYAKFVKAAPTPVIRRDAWRRGQALLKDARREARNNDFLTAYYEKKLLKYEPIFLGKPPSSSVSASSLA